MANIGDLVSASTYNAIVQKINLVLGAGDGAQQGYGRTVKSSAVNSDTIISSALMQNLYDDLTRARKHQRGTTFTWDTPTDGINTPDSGEFIGIFAADLGTSGTTADATADLAEGFLDFEQAAQDIVDDQYDVGSDQMTVTVKDTSTITTAWNGTIRHTVTVTWTNADERRYFFNSGGYIQFDASLTGGTSVAGDVTTTPPGTKDEIWQTMLNNMGAIRFTRTGTSATGTGTGTNNGNYAITSATPTRIFTKDGSGVYSENQYYIDAWQTAANSIRFDIVFVDNDAGDDTAAGLGFPGEGAPVDENVTGEITSNVSTRTARGVLDLNEPAVTTNTELSGGAVGVTYTLGVNSTAVDEGTTVIVTITGNAPNGTSVPWSMTGITTADISLTSLTGSFSIQSGTAQLSFTVLNDALTEGTETITFSSGGQSIDIEIADTSKTVVSTLTASSADVDEGGSVTFTLTTQNANPGNYSYTVTGIDSADLSAGSLTGTITTSGSYSSATGTVTLTLSEDATAEGAETITFSAAGKSVNVTVNDTSAASVGAWPSEPLSAGWGSQFVQLSTAVYTHAQSFAGINFGNDFSNNRVKIDGFTWTNKSTAPLSTGYITYSGYSSPTIEVRFFQSNVVRTHAQINQEDETYDPTTTPSPAGTLTPGTWYTVPATNNFQQFFWIAGERIVQGLNNNDASEASVSSLTANNISFEVRISEAGKPTVVRTSPIKTIALTADLFSDDPV